MNKDKMEEMFRKAGLIPEDKRKYRGYDVLLADGFLSPNDFWKFRWKFPGFLTAKEFPLGAYVSAWIAADGEKLLNAQPLACDAFHDKGNDLQSKKRMRLNSAMEAAIDWLTKNMRAKING